jgi:sugar transferase EpsL
MLRKRKDPVASKLKRMTDLVVAGTALLLCWPLIVLASLLLVFSVGYQPLFRQTRPGLHGRPFTIVKLRTMTNARDAHERLLPDDQRLTRLGALIRLFCIDELPQLWSVIKGEMSLVGPRPLLTEYWELYTPEQRRRHDVKPGMTGWAAVNGGNSLSWEEKFRFDLWYVDNWSFLLDVRIMLKTCGRILKREGVFPEGRVTAELFRGTARKA